MDTNSLMFLFIGIAISAALFALLVFLYPQITERRAEKTIEKATASAEQPVETPAEAPAAKPAERAIFDGYPMMWGADKKKIAESAYDVLPAEVDGRATSAIKSEVSKEQFAEMAQRAFEGFDQFCKENQALFDQQFEAWKQEHPRP